MKHTAVLKNIRLLLLLVSMLFSLAVCSGNDNKETEEKQDLSLDESVEMDSSNSLKWLHF